MSNFDFGAELGSDFACVDDLDADLSLVSGRRALIESSVRRITTSRGGLFYDSSYGINIRDFLSASGLSATQSARIVEGELLKDERVRNVSAQVTFDRPSKAVDIAITIEDEEGPFTLTLRVDALTVEILETDVTT